MDKRYWYGLRRETNPIGIGCWQLAGNYSVNGQPQGWGSVDPKSAVNILERAIDYGFDFFDTAQSYNWGISEQMLGKAIKLTCKKDIVVCTKLALTEKEIISGGLSDDFILRVEESLKNLERDYIDILLIHNPPDNLMWSSFNYSVLDGLVKQGKIICYGVSSRGLLGARNAIEANFGSTIEWILNLFERRSESLLLPLVEEKKMNFIARSSLSRGLINPKYLKNTPKFNINEFRSTLPDKWIEWTLNLVREIHGRGIEADNIVRYAIMYCLSFKAVSATLIGVRNLNQLKDIVEIMLATERNDFFDNNYLNNIPKCYPEWE